LAGKLIAFEGIDGSGTTTQARRMYEALFAASVPVHMTQEPSEGPVGNLIRQILRRRLITPGRTGPRKPRWDTMGLLFAADRLDHIECEIAPNLDDGVTVITDRYMHSSIVYQSVTADLDDASDWLGMINRGAIRPDAIFFLEVHPEVALRRRMGRRSGVEMYDDPELQERIASGYDALFRNPVGMELVRIDGERSEDDVHGQCMEKLAGLDFFSTRCKEEP